MSLNRKSKLIYRILIFINRRRHQSSNSPNNAMRSCNSLKFEGLSIFKISVFLFSSFETIPTASQILPRNILHRNFRSPIKRGVGLASATKLFCKRQISWLDQALRRENDDISKKVKKSKKVIYKSTKTTYELPKQVEFYIIFSQKVLIFDKK